MRVDVIPFLKILQDLFRVDFNALRTHLVCSSLRSDLRRCRHEDLQLRIREDCGAYVTSVHHHSLAFAEFPELPVDEGAHLSHCGYRADLFRNRHRAYFLFYAPLSDVCPLRTETEIQIFHCRCKGWHVYCIVSGDETVFDCKKRDSSVEGTGIQIQE